ncbi:LuxR family transcriptional regulator [Bacillus coahuilensis p1.1.43]|uniref:LuxR family transcriptional regulator n=1 Tax=Bacillus coahuilensis p1.1.43 TaxID=1150625 RepID=A0A147KBL5_9BACI|nr:response regulator transcription factor [Bacillus coahuilensis]KUP08738.1 LuxR family transcriptional regulator [Bacillus coahuilensis p1.1.43]
MKIRIMIVDDQALMRDGLSSILQLKEELEVVATASNGQDAFEKAREFTPDIILMDIRMPGSSGVEGTRLIHRANLPVKVLMLTTFKDTELILEALEEGASGYLLKDMATDTIVQAIKTVYSGGVVLPEDLTAQLFLDKRKTPHSDLEPVGQPVDRSLLTDREWGVLSELGKGLNNREIAEALYITEGTVKNHVSNIISKLEVRDRTQAAIYAVRHGISTTYDF